MAVKSGRRRARKGKDVNLVKPEVVEAPPIVAEPKTREEKETEKGLKDITSAVEEALKRANEIRKMHSEKEVPNLEKARELAELLKEGLDKATNSKRPTYYVEKVWA